MLQIYYRYDKLLFQNYSSQTKERKQFDVSSINIKKDIRKTFFSHRRINDFISKKYYVLSFFNNPPAPCHCIPKHESKYYRKSNLFYLNSPNFVCLHVKKLLDTTSTNKSITPKNFLTPTYTLYVFFFRYSFCDIVIDD